MNRPNWHYVPQRTPKWDALRATKVTGTGVPFVMAKGRDGEDSKTRETYLMEKVNELDTGRPSKVMFETEDMRLGTEREGPGKALYEQLTGEILDDSVGFIDHPTVARFGVSPDGIILPANFSDFPRFGLELKSPRLTTFTNRVLTQRVDGRHLWQCYAFMECAALEGVDYVNFNPERPVGQQLLVIRVYRDEAKIRDMVTNVILFNEEVDERRAALAKARYLYGREA